ncbi:uncharacterized protein LOC125028664 [Penaeus chinensis]|uniref:uncharacterized protein LOC125028664 n=1 Tax=Penaeus chinensis TaxID=139456 RepID=UPI001FB840A4|nr:uncharacterized protein LOC125028664 [Penaeus chinensis]
MYRKGTESAIVLGYEEIGLGLAKKHQINIILRETDVNKAFEKVWHDGLKYSLTHLQFQTHLTHLLCSFLNHRTATITGLSPRRPPLPRKWNTISSPTLYILYTANLP